MNILGNTIAQLRRERGMTQESLAEAIGVSPQTISKWENAATCPDVLLLPVIADVFGVTVDALFGREPGHIGLKHDEALNAAMEQIRRVVVGCFYQEGQRESFEEQVEGHRQALKDGEWTSVIQSGAGEVIYMREPVGALLLRRPEAGWNSLFADEKSLRLLRLMADDAFRSAMQVILRRRMLTFTLPALAKFAGVEDATHLERCLEESMLFTRKTLAIDEETLCYFELSGGEQRLYLMYASLLYAGEFMRDRNRHHYFVGNADYFTP